MKEKHSSNFIIGLLFGMVVAVAAWYWYKSTSAEDGALDLLDRLALAEAKIRELQAELRQQAVSRLQSVRTPEAIVPAEPTETAVSPENLQQVKGIGPVFAQRLQAAGVQTIAGLADLSPERLATLLDIGPARAEAILADARRLVA
ncbi:MAG: helix-hairpin-helix domain-containing protein [Chloroflexi bacterium]|nr:MAG: helix-hairpin-helix domain-containing protein [Chloroflexota bacterium]